MFGHGEDFSTVEDPVRDRVLGRRISVEIQSGDQQDRIPN
jgi:hypothetical protein